MIVVYNQPFLDCISRQDYMIEISEYSIITKFQGVTVSSPNSSTKPPELDISSLIDSTIRNLTNPEKRTAEGVWDKESKNLKLNIEFENHEVSNGCEGIVVYANLLGSDEKFVAFTLINSIETEGTSKQVNEYKATFWVTTTTLKDGELGLCQTKNLITINLPETTLACIICHQSQDLKFLEVYGLEVGVNLYTIKEGKNLQVVSRDSYFKYLREHNSSLPDRTAVKWIDENGMFDSKSYTFRCYTSVNYQIEGLVTGSFPIPTLRGLDWHGGFIQIYGYADYTDYEISGEGSPVELGSGRESISAVPGVEIVKVGSYQDGFNASINNLTKIIKYESLGEEPSDIVSPSGTFEIELTFYNPLTESKEIIKSGKFRFLQALSEGGWYISSTNTPYTENFEGMDVPLYLLDAEAKSKLSFDIMTSLSKDDLIDGNSNPKIQVITHPINNSTKAFDDTFTITPRVTLSTGASTVNKITVEIETKTDNNSTTVWAPMTQGTGSNEFDYIKETRWLYRTGHYMFGINPDIPISTDEKELAVLKKGLNAIVNIEEAELEGQGGSDQDYADWREFYHNSEQKTVDNFWEGESISWAVYSVGSSFWAYYTDTVGIETPEQKRARLQDGRNCVGMIDYYISSCYSTSDWEDKIPNLTKKRKDYVIWKVNKKDFGVLGINGSLKINIDTKNYKKFKIESDKELPSSGLAIGIGTGSYGDDGSFSGEVFDKYSLSGDKKTLTVDLSSKKFEVINTVYIKTPVVNGESGTEEKFTLTITKAYFLYERSLASDKKIELSVNEFSRIYNSKYSVITYIGGKVSYTLDMSGITTGLIEVNNPGEFISRLYITEVICAGYRSYFYAVQKCKSNPLYIIDSLMWASTSSSPSMTYSSKEITFDRGESLISNVLFTGSDYEEFDIENSNSYNTWVVLNNPNSAITIREDSGDSFGYLKHNPKTDKDSLNRINIQVNEELDYIGIKSYDPITIARVKRSTVTSGVDIQNDWRSVVGMSTCNLYIKKRGLSPSLRVSSEYLNVSNIGVYSFTVYSNCPFYVDLSGAHTARDTDNFGNGKTVAAFCEYSYYSPTNTYDTTLFYHSSYNETYGTQVYLVLKRLPEASSSTSQPWGYISVFPESDVTEDNTCSIEVLGSPMSDHIGYDRNIKGYKLDQTGMINETNTTDHIIVMGDKNNNVYMYGKDTFAPYGRVFIPTGSYLFKLGSTSSGKITDLAPEFESYRYQHHVSTYTQYYSDANSGYAAEEIYPLNSPRLIYYMYCAWGGDREIFTIWGKGRPLKINNTQDSYCFVDIYNDSVVTKDITFNYPVWRTSDYYEVIYEYSDSTNPKFDYSAQSKVGGSIFVYPGTINFSMLSDYSSVTGHVGDLIVTFRLKEEGLVLGKEFDRSYIDSRVSTATYRYKIYHYITGGEGEESPTERYFSNFFDGLEFDFIGGTATTYPVWLDEDGGSKYCDLDKNQSYSSDFNWSGSSNYFSISVSNRLTSKSFDISDYTRYADYYEVKSFYGTAAMYVLNSSNSYDIVHSQAFTVTQKSLRNCIIFKSDSKPTTVYFTNSSENEYIETIPYSTTEYNCILTGAVLTSSTSQISPNNVVPGETTYTTTTGTDVTLEQNSNEDFTGWINNNVKIKFPVNNSPSQREYTFTANFGGDTAFTLKLRQAGNSGTVQILDKVADPDHLPFLSNGCYIGDVDNPGVLTFKTDIPTGELTIKVGDVVFSGDRLVYINDEENSLKSYKIENLYISSNTSKSLVTKDLVFERTYGGRTFSALDCKTCQGYYCFELDGFVSGSTISANIPSYGQDEFIPWECRKIFINKLTQQEVNPRTGLLDPDTLKENLQGSFTLSTDTGLQKIQSAEWRSNNLSVFSDHSTKIVWGESQYENDDDKKSSYPFLENTYHIAEGQGGQSVVVNVELQINVKYPKEATTKIEQYLKDKTLDFTYVLNLNKPSIPEILPSWNPSGDLEMSSDSGSSSIAISAEGGLGDVRSEDLVFKATSNSTDWLTVTSSSNNSFSINVIENTGAQRSGTITFALEKPFVGNSRELVVIQSEGSSNEGGSEESDTPNN